MGTDGTVIVERQENDIRWEPIAVLHLPRCYDLFNDIRAYSVAGYPTHIHNTSRMILDNTEDWGEGWMDYKTFRKLLKQYKCSRYDVIKKKFIDQCRVISRFDN